MGSLNPQDYIMELNKNQVVVIMVPLPAQGHLNQLLQLSCIISSYGLPVHYIGSAVHNQQARVRATGLDHSKIHFHDLPTPPSATPPPNPNASNKFPVHLQPTWNATVNLREPVAEYLREMSGKARRIVVVHDPLMACVIQDIRSIPNGESYVFNCFSAFAHAYYIVVMLFGKPLPVHLPKKLPSLEGCLTEEILSFSASQAEARQVRSGDLYNTSRLIEGPFLDSMSSKEIVGDKKTWAIGPILPAAKKSASALCRHKSLEWLDEQEPKSVIYVSFGTTTSLPDEQITELALGLERSERKFIWVLRDADKGNVFNGEDRRAELPDGFEERVRGTGMVIRDWAPQPEILAHPSTGGFMSHCGWNSCVESISMGVPIAAWPMHSDQPTNAYLVADILKIGLVVREIEEKDEVVRAERIENVVKGLVGSEEGAEIRKRAEELGAAVRRATEEGGVSRVELDSFVAHLTRDSDDKKLESH